MSVNETLPSPIWNGDPDVETVNRPMPPIGILPRCLWDERRYIELDNAIYRYENSDWIPLQAWYDERNELERAYPYLQCIKNVGFENPLRKGKAPV